MLNQDEIDLSPCQPRLEPTRTFPSRPRRLTPYRRKKVRCVCLSYQGGERLQPGLQSREPFGLALHVDRDTRGARSRRSQVGVGIENGAQPDPRDFEFAEMPEGNRGQLRVEASPVRSQRVGEQTARRAGRFRHPMP